MSKLLSLGTLCQRFKPIGAFKDLVKLPHFSTASPTMTRAAGTHSPPHTQQQKGTVGPPENNEWRSIYRLPLIPLASAFNRLKVPYAYLNVVVIPGAFALENASQLPPTTAILISSVGITTLLTLSICSYFIRNLVGIIYINDDNDKLKVAYVDYWGKRHDQVIELKDLVPENEKRRPAKQDFYQSLTLYSNDKVKYKLLQRFGHIEDPEVFVTLFGSN
ncbi:transmembrane protein 186 [Stomoxys calcitrans]|uniref:Transmembrane protein 186 n=1 Tax=Stomoxys calcitrans TaxID=35570 RepID=A0A1I8PHI9_STOCA|nr:transmembrane protein 186 [Stomoxys calcitrans]